MEMILNTMRKTCSLLLLSPETETKNGKILECCWYKYKSSNFQCVILFHYWTSVLPKIATVATRNNYCSLGSTSSTASGKAVVRTGDLSTRQENMGPAMKATPFQSVIGIMLRIKNQTGKCFLIRKD